LPATPLPPSLPSTEAIQLTDDQVAVVEVKAQRLTAAEKAALN
jgi:hypothetical protein